MMKRVLLTGATGSMGLKTLEFLVKNNKNKYNIRLLIQNTKRERKIIKKYLKEDNIEIKYGDLTNFQDIYNIIDDVDMVLHVGAFVSPEADYNPKLAMEINYGGTKNIINAISQKGQNDKTKFVYIGSIAQTGDRMPPIHWGRIGDPIKPSIYDYYAVSKTAAERYVIESDIKYWVSLRQTGILGTAMIKKANDAIILHNPLNNVLEYVSDRDSGRLLSNLWYKDLNEELDKGFWNHIYNIGGGISTRIDTITLYENLYGALGIKDLKNVIDPKIYATQNFHGTYYLDSDKLNDYLDFRHDSIDYLKDLIKKEFGLIGIISKLICKFPNGEKLIGKIIKKHLKKIAQQDRGTISFIKNDSKPNIIAYYGSKEAYQEIPDDFKKFSRYHNFEKIVYIDHGYDEVKPEANLTNEDLKRAVEFRGGKLLSEMKTGDWESKQKYKCAFGHEFTGSPRLILEGGHWCLECEKKSWNYSNRAKKDKFFAQVYKPIKNENEILKIISEDDIK